MLETAIAMSAAALVTSAVTAVGAHRVWSNRNPCSGHNWDEEKPFYDGNGKPFNGEYDVRMNTLGKNDLHLGMKPEEVSLRVSSVKKCKDCGETKKGKVFVGKVPFEAFERGVVDPRDDDNQYTVSEE